MKNQIRLGRFFGVEVGLHVSWFIIAFLITLSVAQEFQMHNPDWTTLTVWGTAVFTGLLFFATIVIHELSHALVAKSHGIPVRSITLFALGGVAQIEKESTNAKTEFQIGIVGPITSFIIGLWCLMVARCFGWVSGTPPQPILALLVWLGYINFALGAFNLIPGFPLDGGRVLRAVLWWMTRDGRKATRWAAQIGHLAAMGFILLGIFEFFLGAGFNGLWLAFIGWFLNDAAHASAMQVDLSAALEGMRVKDIMTSECPVVSGTTDVETFVHENLLRSGRRCFVVEEGGRRIGIMTSEDVKHLSRDVWTQTPIDHVMRRWDQMRTVPINASAKTALDKMAKEEVNQLAVVSEGRVEGIVSRGHILQLLKTHTELSA